MRRYNNLIQLCLIFFVSIQFRFLDTNHSQLSNSNLFM